LRISTGGRRLLRIAFALVDPVALTLDEVFDGGILLRRWRDGVVDDLLDLSRSTMLVLDEREGPV